MGSIAERSRTSGTVIIGVDPHPGSHTARAHNGLGEQLDEITVVNDESGLSLLGEWAKKYPSRQWAVEGPGNRYIRGFVDELLSGGEMVYSVTPSMTAEYRKRNSRGKDDEIDATSAAKAVLANKDLPAYRPMPYEAELKELTRSYQRIRRQLTATRMSAKQMAYEDVRLALEQVIQSLETARDSLKRRMASFVKETAPGLLKPLGNGPVVAATLLAEAGRVSRFPSEAHFASYAGSAPIPWSSGAQVKMRVNPGGNRRLNWAAHMVANTRLRLDPRTQQYRDRKLAEGKTQREVYRLLKTYICREFYHLLRHELARFESGISSSPCSS
jgi:transposase